MDTSLKLFSEAFDVTPEEMYILMLSDKEFFKEPLKIKMNYGEIRLNRELMDKLENLYYEKKDSVEVPILEVAQVLRTTEKELNSIMGKYPDDFKRMTRVVKADGVRYIKYKCITKLVIRLSNARKRTIQTDIPEEKPKFMPEPKPALSKEEKPIENNNNTQQEISKTPKKEEPAEKKKPKKKKFGLTKTALKDIGRVKTDNIRELRAFLLDVGEFKPEEIALMPDAEVLNKMDGYVVLSSGEQTIIIRRTKFRRISTWYKEGDSLNNNNPCFGCKIRRPYCHSVCDRYKNMQIENERAKEIIRKKRQELNEYMDMRRDSVERSIAGRR